MTFGLSMGEDCVISPTARFIGVVVLGDRVTIADGAVIGSTGGHRHLGPRTTEALTIGDDTVIHENVVIHRGLEAEGKRFWGTSIGARCYIMAGAVIEHDAQIGKDVTIAAQVGLGGHAAVLDGANIGIGAAVHQNVTIGACAMVGMGATVLSDVPTGVTVVGCPARVIGINTIGIERAGYNTQRMASLAGAYGALAGDRPGVAEVARKP
jgi:UDP-N-acetylglucosamine acyltransferase